MVGVPRKFPSPDNNGDDGDGDDIEMTSCEELVVTGITLNQTKTSVSVLHGSGNKKCKPQTMTTTNTDCTL